MSTDDWWACQIAIAHYYGGHIPHGSTLPDEMPWDGDMYVLENEDGTDTVYVWMPTGWNKGPNLIRPRLEEGNNG